MVTCDNNQRTFYRMIEAFIVLTTNVGKHVIVLSIILSHLRFI